MIDKSVALELLAASDERRAERRRFLKFAGTGTALVGASALLAACGDDNDDDTGVTPPTPAPTPTPGATPSEGEVLNFALNLEYLEATFYSLAAFGTGLDVSLTAGGNGAAPGSVTGGRQVAFADTVVAQYAREIANDEIAHVRFLRRNLGSAAAALPPLNIDGGASGAFTAAARAAGVVPSTGTFDPYANDDNFLLAAYIFEDVGVTAYKGGARFINTPAFIEAAAGLLGAEAYHAGLVRTVLYARGVQTPSLITAANAISDARDSLDGSTDLDQGITRNGMANIVPTDDFSVAYSRSPQQVLNIVYLNNAAVSMGGFFPAGVTGTIRTSGAN